MTKNSVPPASNDTEANSLHFADILNARLSRRQTMLGGISATTAALFGSLSLSACGGGDDPAPTTPPTTPPTDPVVKPTALGFSPVAHSVADVVQLPTGYSMSVLYALGDPLVYGISSWAGDGSETGASYELRAGDHHDGMYFFGLAESGTYDPKRSDRGLLCLNHENITRDFLHPAGTSYTNPRPANDVDKEVNAHGVSIVEVKRGASGNGMTYVRGSMYNRRLTAATPMELEGPVRGHARVVTKYSAAGTRTRGTVNNCANGMTPWGTYLTCEENWEGYFRRDADTTRADNASLNRYSLTANQSGSNGWSQLTGDLYERWYIAATGATAADDYRNAANTYGWIVEVDPFDPNSTPVKRTALGRFAHEGCWPCNPVAGKPMVFYMGDDKSGDYIYKFVSTAKYDPADKGLAAGAKYMNDGTLYVARFDASGAGEWLPLTTANPALAAFPSLADIMIDTRLAADAVGATKMDRPEWGAVNPLNGEVYMTLTNSNNTLNAANPRPGNPNGHIIRWHEDGSDAAATTFKWDVYLFGSPNAAPATYNISGLTASNDMSSPDGLWFDSRGILWIQTDDGAYTGTTNCMMLAATPGTVGDGGAATPTGNDGTTPGVATLKGANPTEANLRRFLVGPIDCEITGIAMTPDHKTMFVNIQHPGDGGTGHWPASQTNPASTARPRSATIAITKDDGGEIAV